MHFLLGYIPPHRNTIQKRLKKLNDEQKILLVNELIQVQSVGVTCDFWTDKRLYSYMCLTGHFITSAFQFVSRILSFSWFHHRHSSVNITTAIESNLKELNIYEKTTSITTDGAANMVKMFDSLRSEIKRVHCMCSKFISLLVTQELLLGIAHRLHLVVCNSLGLWVCKRQEPSSFGADPNQQSDNNSRDSDDDDFTDDLVPDIQTLFIDEGKEQSSMSNKETNNNSDDDENSLDEVLIDEEFTDAQSNPLDDNWSLDIHQDFDPSMCELEEEVVGTLMKKCRSFVKLVNKSSILMNYIAYLKPRFNVNRSLQIDCKSRWNSTYRIIETMLIYKKIINKLNSEKNEIGLNYKQARRLSTIELDLSDWKLMEALEYVLKPFIQATKLLSASQYSTIGIAFFAIVQIRDFLEDSKSHENNDSKLIHRLKTLLLRKLEFYFDEHDDQWALMKVSLIIGLFRSFDRCRLFT